MTKRTPLSQRVLPDYTRGEEIMNMVTHIVGGALGLMAGVICILRASLQENPWGIVAYSLYSFTLIGVYTISSVYHGLHESMAKRIMQVIDHCAIYFLIAGTYTAVLLGSLRTEFPRLAWSLFLLEWGLAAIAATLTAIDLNKYNVFSMICYITMGWAILPFWRQVTQALTAHGFALLLWGGIAYSIGAVLYGIGAKKRWMHSVFHIFVILGSMLHFYAIAMYGL